jgi:hypothetical protein
MPLEMQAKLRAAKRDNSFVSEGDAAISDLLGNAATKPGSRDTRSSGRFRRICCTLDVIRLEVPAVRSAPRIFHYW